MAWTSQHIVGSQLEVSFLFSTADHLQHHASWSWHRSTPSLNITWQPHDNNEYDQMPWYRLHAYITKHLIVDSSIRCIKHLHTINIAVAIDHSELSVHAQINGCDLGMHRKLTATLIVHHLCEEQSVLLPNIIMPRWAEPRRHTVVCVSGAESQKPLKTKRW